MRIKGLRIGLELGLLLWMEFSAGAVVGGAVGKAHPPPGSIVILLVL